MVVGSPRLPPSRDALRALMHRLYAFTPEDRRLLLDGLPSEVVGTMALDPRPLVQFDLDLSHLARLPSGFLGRWCRNGARLLSPQPEAAELERIAHWLCGDDDEALASPCRPALVRVQPGAFEMGERRSRRAHRRPVELSRPLMVARHPMTRGQHRALHDEAEGHDSTLPLGQISWIEACRICNALSAHECLPPFYRLSGDGASWCPEGSGYRMLFEAEWEYACRAGSSGRYWFGDHQDGLGAYAWYAGNTGGRPRPIGTRPYNPWGLAGMHGNVWEWVNDWYAPYAPGPGRDPTGPAEGSHRVIRGGSFRDDPAALRSAFRSAVRPRRRAWSIGLRIARRWQGPQPLTRVVLPHRA